MVHINQNKNQHELHEHKVSVLCETNESSAACPTTPVISDKGLYENNTSLNEDEIRVLLLAGPGQPKECDMSGREFKKSIDNRHFNSSLYYINKEKPLVGNICSA